MALARKHSDVPVPTKRQSFVTKRRAESMESRPSSSYMTPTRFTGLLAHFADNLFPCELSFHDFLEHPVTRSSTIFLEHPVARSSFFKS